MAGFDIRFITTPGIEPTNNLAEQAIRFVVLDRHVTQGTRGEVGQRWSERIWTVIATCTQTKAATNTGGWLNVEQFLGGTGTNTLIGANKTSTWTLTGSGTGDLTGGIHFQGFTNLTGGSAADTFDLTSGGDWSGLLDGASGLDTLVAPAGGTYASTGPNAGTLNGRAFKGIERRQ